MKGYYIMWMDFARRGSISFFHILYCLYTISSVLASDLSNVITTILKLNPENRGREDEEEPESYEAYEPPIVFIHGLFGFGKGKMGEISYFGGAEKMGRVVVPDLGACTSIYDRARRLFYYLKGGQVDYGEEHSKANCHSRFGIIYNQGKYPNWDEEHPLHFVAHSAGAQVVRMLQQMLADKTFNGHECTSENWVLSLTCISGAMNGCTRSYLDGMMEENWKLVRPMSFIHFIHVPVAIYIWLDIIWLKKYYNFGFDHFELSWREIGFLGLMDYIMGNIGPIASGDWVIPDLTIPGSIALNSQINTFPNTYYFSYASKNTEKLNGVTVPRQIFKMHPTLWIRCWQMCRFRFVSNVNLPYKGFMEEDWEDNDGALNTISMTHPRIPIQHPSQLVPNICKCLDLQPGIWNYKIVEADHMSFVFNRKRDKLKFDSLYSEVFERCEKYMVRKKTIRTLEEENAKHEW